MANWCNNTVVFEGKPEAIEQVRQLFQAMAEKEGVEKMGQLPDFATIHINYFFDIHCDEGETGLFQFQTKWSPNLETVQAIAEHYKVDFTQDYEELGWLVYGRATYAGGILTNIYLNDEAFEAYSYNEKTDTYHFEGETYESEYEILETLLERKITNHQHYKTSRMETTAIATKFVRHDVPELKTLQFSKVYQLREKLNKIGKMNRAEKNWLAEAVNRNAYFKRAVPLMGYRFGFEDVLKTYVVKQYGSWSEYNAPDKTSLRSIVYGRIDQITEINNS